MISGVVGIFGKLSDSVCCLQVIVTRYLLIKTLGELFLKQLEEAYIMQDRHCSIFQQFSSTFSSQTI